jgi:hypothetical protein
MFLKQAAVIESLPADANSKSIADVPVVHLVVSFHLVRFAPIVPALMLLPLLLVSAAAVYAGCADGRQAGHYLRGRWLH